MTQMAFVGSIMADLGRFGNNLELAEGKGRCISARKSGQKEVEITPHAPGCVAQFCAGVSGRRSPAW
jgi:hypothetical protein